MPDSLTFSATDLSNFLGCRHLALLDRRAKLGGPKPPKYPDPALDALRQRGLDHERAYERSLRDQGLHVVRIDEPPREHEYWTSYTAATLDAMRTGADVIVQGGLWDGRWVGRPDFLRRVDDPSAPARWRYEVIDTKLAREAKGGALLQVLLYADLVERLFGAAPEHVHLALGGPEQRTETIRVAEYAAYFRSARDRFLRFQTEAPLEIPRVADPVSHCDVCAWKTPCAEQRRMADHLSLVAGIGRGQRQVLVENGIATLAAFATVDLGSVQGVNGSSARSLERVQHQARVQLEGRTAGRPVYELLPLVEGEGLASLPEPSPGDLFFDLEGNPYAHVYGIEYLFGVADAEGDYRARWALTREAEKGIFEAFIDSVMARLERYPELHIYHFAPYEPTALKRLMGFHGTREAEVDRLLRGGVFVDLHRVVRQGVRASVESYSIKKLEQFYGYERDVELRDASLALSLFDAWLEMGSYEERQEELMRQVEAYNRDDCVSTLRLRDWLETLRLELEATVRAPVPRPEPSDGAPDEALEERQAEIAARIDALMDGVPADPEERTEEQQGRWLLAQLVEFHRRENKAMWWEYYRCLELSDDEAIEDRSTLGGLEYEGVVGTVARSEIHRYRFPPQDHSVRGGAHDHATQKPAGTIVDLDNIAGFIDLKRGRNSTTPHPRVLVPYDHMPDAELRESILRVTDKVIAHGLTGDCPARAAVDLLLHSPPRIRGDGAARLMTDDETTLDTACRLVTELEGTVLPIQGPPGAGKTYTGAAMIVRALEQGKRVGVTATSHKVISNLLTAVCRAAEKAGVAISGVQKGDEGQWCGESQIRIAGDNAAVADALRTGAANLAAGTAWLWSREEMMGSVDLLFVDEAGQFSLANAVAVSPAADTLVLLGDPRQLDQPQQGVHPPGADLSALDHLLAGETTIAPDRGIFLAKTWRLHPAICAFTSEIFYDGRLESRSGLDVQEVRGPEGLNGNGLRFVPVLHQGNQSESAEEVEVVAELVARLTSECKWIDEDRVKRPITLSDVLIVAPYNAQVSAIAARLPDGARVGTVDKFQGQEAPVVIYSLTTSSAGEAPRGMEFLYSPNRLNVATSRARCLAIAVASPDVFLPDCRTPAQMKLANAFCRFREIAAELPFREG